MSCARRRPGGTESHLRRNKKQHGDLLGRWSGGPSAKKNPWGKSEGDVVRNVHSLSTRPEKVKIAKMKKNGTTAGGFKSAVPRKKAVRGKKGERKKKLSGFHGIAALV